MQHHDDFGTYAPTRSLALQIGATLYQGAPCRHGHGHGLRYASTRACVECRTDRNLIRTRSVRQRERIRKARQRERQATLALLASPLGRLFGAALAAWSH